MNLRYRMIGESLYYKRVPTLRELTEDTTPRLLSFVVHNSELNSNIIPIVELTGNQFVTHYIVTDTPIPPSLDNYNWSPEPPPDFYF